MSFLLYDKEAIAQARSFDGLGCVVYTLTWSGKIYVGSTKNLGRRVIEWRSDLLEFDAWLEVVEICQPELRYARESYWVRRLDSFFSGHNKSPSGHGTGPRTEAGKAAIAAANKKRDTPIAAREARSRRQSGEVRSYAEQRDLRKFAFGFNYSL